MKTKKVKQEQRQEQAVDYKEKYLKALADYQNLIKRVEKEKEDFVKFANEHLILRLLAVFDSLEKAVDEFEDESIKLIAKELWYILEKEGVEQIEVRENDDFDPAIMECIEAEEDGKRLIVTRKGYKMKGRVIRAAEVKVVK